MLTVREFVESAFQLINPSSPTVPLHGSDLSIGIRILNQLFAAYAATGLMLTVAKETHITLTIGQQNIVTGEASFTPTPDITLGRLAVLESAWLLLDNVTYPLINLSREEFNAAWKYNALTGLPRFIMVMPDIQTTSMRIFPSPSQVFEFYIRAKFQLSTLTSNDDMDTVPTNYELYFLYAVARQLAKFKGRNAAWTPDLEQVYNELKLDMEASSEINVAIKGNRESLLNGAWALRAGIS